MTTPLSIHICTKDSSESLKRLLDDIRSLDIKRGLRCFVYDDSVHLQHRTLNRYHVSDLPFEAVYIDETYRQHVLEAITWPSVQAQAYATYSLRPLGQPGWDASGVKALASFIACMTAAPADNVLFVDDDIRLTTTPYNGVQFVIDPTIVNMALSQELPGHTIIGAAFSGRADVPLSHHLYESLISSQYDSSGGTTTKAYDGGRSQLQWKDAPAIGGGFMLLQAKALALFPLARCFNEDWIFLTLAEASGYQQQLAPFKPTHCGNEIVHPGVDIAHTQQVGQAMLRSIHYAVQQVGVSSLERLCVASLRLAPKYVDDQISTWRSILNLEQAIASFADNSEEEVRSLLNRTALLETTTHAIKNYFAIFPGWRDVVSDARLSEAVRDITAKAL